MLIKDLVKLVGQTAQDGRRLPGQLIDLAKVRVLSHPQVVFALLRDIRPVFVHSGVAFVTRYDDVVEVLGHDQAFSVEGYSGPMREITGDFILGLDQGPLYERSISLLRLAFRQTDVAAIAAQAREMAQNCVSAAEPNGSLDVVTDLANRVPARLVASYLGAPGPDEETLTYWARTLFTHIFVDLDHDRILTDEALAAAAAIRPYIDGLVSERKAALAGGASVPEDVLTRLLRQQNLGDEAFTDIEIRNNLIGLLVGMIPTTSKASALAIDELFRRPAQLDGARAAIRDGDDALFDRYVSEAMRLNPQAPGLIRHAVDDYPIARGTHHETLIKKGTIVFASTQSAMLDPEVVEDPHEFRLDRPDSVYLHFGVGLHACFGRYINAVVIPAIVKAALALPAGVRAPGRAGLLTIDRTWPTTMRLEFLAVRSDR